MDYRDNKIYLSQQETEDLECGPMLPDYFLDDLIVDTELAAFVSTAVTNARNKSIFGERILLVSEAQYYNPRQFRLLTALDKLYAIREERDAHYATMLSGGSE